MSAFKQLGAVMSAAARAHAAWELEISRTILGDPRRIALVLLLLVPILVFGPAVGAQVAEHAADAGVELPHFLGGKSAYSPAFYSTKIFVASILIGLCAGLITGCIGAGGGFIIAPALMSAGVKGILAVGTDLFHIFAKAIMGSVIHRKLGNVSVPLAVTFLIGSIGGATLGGVINREIYEINPLLSDAFITTIYSIILGLLGTYAMTDYLRARKRPEAQQVSHGGRSEGADIGNLPRKLQAVNAPPMVHFDQDLVPGGRKISAWFLIASGFLVGFAASIMGVGGGFLTFPIFVYTLGVSSMTTVGTDIFQIVFTAGYAAITQYAIYGFIFYTLAMGMLIGSLVGVQIGAMVTKVVKGITIRGFYAMAVLAGFVNRIFALPGKLADLEVISLSPAASKTLAAIGVWAFFLVIGTFAVWVISTFLRNIRTLRGEEAARRPMKREQSTKLVIGIVLLVSFLAVLVAIFLPLFGGDSALNVLDNLFNSISKGSAYYVPKVLQQIESHPATAVSLSLGFKQAEVGARAATLLEKAGATVEGGGPEIQVQGDLLSILKACAADADSAYHGRGAEIEARYGLAAEPALQAWWSTLSAIERDLTKQKLFADARLVHSVQTKAVECAYNYYGIEASKISERWGIVLLSLAFYVLYTVWYGYAILYIFEGLGMRLSH